MLLLLLAMAGEAPAQNLPASAVIAPARASAAPTAMGSGREAQADLQSCEMTKEGWLCRYRMPSVTLLGSADGSSPPVVVFTPQPSPPAVEVETPPGAPLNGREEAARQARLIARCADAPWWAICLPDDRRAAKRLQAEKAARDALRADVAKAIAEGRCTDAVQRALKAGDLELAREAKGFCSP